MASPWRNLGPLPKPTVQCPYLFNGFSVMLLLVSHMARTQKQHWVSIQQDLKRAQEILKRILEKDICMKCLNVYTASSKKFPKMQSKRAPNRVQIGKVYWIEARDYELNACRNFLWSLLFDMLFAVGHACPCPWASILFREGTHSIGVVASN